MENKLIVLKKKSLSDHIIDIALYIIITISIIILLFSSIIIVKKCLYPNKVPDIFKVKPFIVLTGSMNPIIESGDLVFVYDVDTSTLKEGDIIAFRSTENQNAVILHRIISIVQERRKINLYYKR